jgi:hypothetical protein
MFGKKIRIVNGERKIEDVKREILKDIEKMDKYKNVIKSTQQTLIE